MDTRSISVVLISLILSVVGLYHVNHQNSGRHSVYIQLPSSSSDLFSSRWPLIATKTITEPPFIMSLPIYEEDSLRYDITKTGKYYETGLTRTVSEILTSNAATALPKTAVIDVGCNAGWYTLYSAAIFREQGNEISRTIFCFEVI